MVQIPENEIQRIEALLRFRILDTEADEVYDIITNLAAAIMDVPMAAINLIDTDRFFLKSKVGFSVNNGSRENSICAHAILDTNPTLIMDTNEDSRFKDNPYVLGNPKIRFYFGCPLLTANNEAIGMLCTLDTQTRLAPTPQQVKGLQYLARLIMKHLELREHIFELYDDFQKLKNLQINDEQTRSEISKVYTALSENCDIILGKIKARKQKR